MLDFLSVATAPASSASVWASLVLAGSLLGMIALTFWFPLRSDGPDDDDFGDDRGGPPPEEPTPPEPSWWPEFEGEFAAYVAAAGRCEAGVR